MPQAYLILKSSAGHRYLRRWRDATGRWRYAYQSLRFVPNPLGPLARSAHEARTQLPIPAAVVLEHIMSTNPPAQVKDGRMTPDEWASHYMSDEPKGYALMHVHPAALYYPAPPDMQKVQRMRRQPGASAPPVVIDANDKMEIPQTAGVHDAVRGMPPQPHTVLDGKHRALAAVMRSESTIAAVVPKRLIGRLWRDSQQAERDAFVVGWAKRQGWQIRGRVGKGYEYQTPDGRRHVLTGSKIDSEARERRYRWKFAGEA